MDRKKTIDNRRGKDHGYTWGMTGEIVLEISCVMFTVHCKIVFLINFKISYILIIA